MKFKYKKMILLITMSSMGIGLLTLSITKDQSKAKGNIEASAETSALLNGNDEMRMFAALEEDVDIAPKEGLNVASNTDGTLVVPTVAPTLAPTPTPIPVYPLEENEAMDSLFEDYYIAKSVSDVKKIQTMFSDPSKIESQEQMQSKVKFIEEYRNIKSYSKKGLEEGSFITYVYHEIKFSGINTLAPGLAKFYVVTDEQGDFKIYSDEMDATLKEYFASRNMDEDVIALIDKTNKNSKEAKEKDEDLKIFWDGLDNLAGNDNAQDTEEE